MHSKTAGFRAVLANLALVSVIALGWLTIIATGGDGGGGGGVTGDTLTLVPSKDNTLYEDATGSLSNGAGAIVAGRTGGMGGGLIRRAVMHFDIASVIPAGATINSVTLTLNVAAQPPMALPRDFTLHRLEADWGEGTSLASPPGPGAAATPDDATWVHTFFDILDTSLWASAGGDFNPTASASQTVSGVGLHTWSTAQMATDVQAWLDTPSANFGWALKIDDETQSVTARIFDSRETPDPVLRPVLTVDFVDFN